jgi:hypothetical protein
MTMATAENKSRAGKDHLQKKILDVYVFELSRTTNK